MNLPALNFPPFEFRYQQNAKGTVQIFDSIRKKFVDLTPEEWVRQHVIHFLIQHRYVPSSMVAVEKQLVLNNTRRRTDIVVYNSRLHPVLLIECKAPGVEISQNTIDQSLRYNLELKVPAIMLSNGAKHIFLKMDSSGAAQLSDIPEYDVIRHF